MITLQRLGAVRKVATQREADALIAQGYKVIKGARKEDTPAGEKADGNNKAGGGGK